jgi:hypothetical protein
MTSSPLHGRLCIIIAVSIILSSLSVVGLSIQEAHAQTSTNKTTGWTRFWEEDPTTTLSSNYVLRVIWIECRWPEDNVGGDETVVKMFGADYYQWGPQSMTDGETKSIDWGVDFSGNSPIRIEVWDYDLGWLFDDHDRIDVILVPAKLTPEIIRYVFLGEVNEAEYVVAVEVLPHRR